MTSGRVLFFSAPRGFGKSTLANALLSDLNVLCLNAGAADFSLSALADEWDILLIDDFQSMQEETDAQTLCELIRSSPAQRFVLLSRGAPPGYLMAFQYTGLMSVLSADDLLFDRDDIRKLFAAHEVAVTDSEISGILKESVGYPLGAVIAVQCMTGGKSFGPEIVAQAFRQVFPISRPTSTAASTCRSAASCWSLLPLNALIWRWRGWSAEILMRANGWIGC